MKKIIAIFAFVMFVASYSAEAVIKDTVVLNTEIVKGDDDKKKECSDKSDKKACDSPSDNKETAKKACCSKGDKK